jgi:uncharacterized protein
MRINAILRAFAFVAFFSGSTSTFAAGFDCAQAVTQVEILICDTPELNRLDDDLDSLYQLTKAHPNKAQLLQQLREWLGKRNACENEQCLLRAYQRFLPAFGERVLGPLEAKPPSSEEPITPNRENAQVERSDPTEPEVSARAARISETGLSGKRATATQGNQDISSVFPLSDLQIEQLLKLSAWIVVGALILMVVLGLTGKVVIFYDVADAWWSISPFVFMVVGFIIAISLAPKGGKFAGTGLEQATLALALIGALVGVFLTFANAIKYNRSIALGLLVGLGKALISVLMAITFIGSFSGATDSRSSSRQAIGPAIVLAIVGFLWVALVNGRKVHIAKGWIRTA